MHEEAMSREQLIEEIRGLRQQYEELQDTLAQAWLEAGQLGAGEAELRLIVESIPMPVMISRLSDGEVMFANDKFGPMFGIRRSELIGSSVVRLFSNPDEYAVLTARIRREGLIHGHEIRARDIHGRFFWVAASFRFLEYHGEQAVFSAYVDITERIEMAQRLQVAKQEAETASLAKSTFLAHMSHELRMPLNAIIGYSELLAERVTEDGHYELYGEDLEKVISVSKLQLGIINDALDLSKIEAGKMTFVEERVDIRKLLAEIMIASRPLAQKNANLLELDVQEEIGEIWGDPTKIRQILLNLVSNAAKFTEEGTITLSAERLCDHLGERINFRVRDTGIGMSDSEIENIFKAFVQAEAKIARKYGGTGLGLAISRQLAQMMGGDISVESKPGEGSLFLLSIPAKMVRAVGDS